MAMIPEPSGVVKLNQKFETFYGEKIDGNVTVINFTGSYSKEQVQEITNQMSAQLKKNMVAPNMKAMVSVGVKYPFGYKSSQNLTELGQVCNIWDPYEYDPDEELMKKYNDVNMRIKSFDMYIMMTPTQGGCSGPYNDCFYDCLKRLTNNKLPEQINHPKKLKKFFKVDRKDLIDINSPEMPKLEKLLANCNIYIGGDHQYISQQPSDRRYKYYINLKGKHYTPKHIPKREKLGMIHEEKKPITFIIDKRDVMDIYSENGHETVPYAKFDEFKKKYNMIPCNKNSTLEETYNDFMENATKLKEMTSDKFYQINLFKTGDLRNTVKTMFTQFTYGIPEPDEIDEFEGRLLKAASRGGLQMCKQYKGECYKYDFVSRYGSIMCSTKCIPMKKGKFATITQKEMDEKIAKKHTPKYGIYNCKISSVTQSNYDLFGFNKHNQYTHEDIELAILLGLKIEVIEKENNAYIYDKSDLVPMKHIFTDYIEYCFELKKERVPYSKELLSLLWGVLSKTTKHRRIFKPNDEPKIISANYNPAFFTRLDNGTYQIEYADTAHVYVYNWARLGTFLTSMARSQMAKFLLRRFDDVIYCHTDGFLLKNKLITDKSFSEDLHGLRYEGHNNNIEIVNMRNIKNNKKDNYTIL
jgi:hypothetical protein